MTWFLPAMAAALGAIVGSFLNVVIHRYPREESIVFPPSKCPDCGTPIKPYDNVPILGYLWLLGRCRACRSPISPRYPLVELANALKRGADPDTSGADRCRQRRLQRQCRASRDERRRQPLDLSRRAQAKQTDGRRCERAMRDAAIETEAVARPDHDTVESELRPALVVAQRRPEQRRSLPIGTGASFSERANASARRQLR